MLQIKTLDDKIGKGYRIDFVDYILNKKTVEIRHNPPLESRLFSEDIRTAYAIIRVPLDKLNYSTFKDLVSKINTAFQKDIPTSKQNYFEFINTGYSYSGCRINLKINLKDKTYRDLVIFGEDLISGRSFNRPSITAGALNLATFLGVVGCGLVTNPDPTLIKSFLFYVASYPLGIMLGLSNIPIWPLEFGIPYHIHNKVKIQELKKQGILELKALVNELQEIEQELENRFTKSSYKKFKQIEKKTQQYLRDLLNVEIYYFDKRDGLFIKYDTENLKEGRKFLDYLINGNDYTTKEEKLGKKKKY